MKPFDLQAAIRGEPVVARDNRPYKFGAYNPDAAGHSQVIGWIDGQLVAHYGNGDFYNNDADRFDLFMAPRKRTVFVNIFARDAFKYATPCHETEESAKLERETLEFNGVHVIAGPIKVEFEE